VRPGVAIEQRDGYSAALTGLWNRLARALGDLEAIASDSDELLDEPGVLDKLPSLQYSLHAAAELVVGLQPPPGAEAAHAELASALACARDTTADVAEAADYGGADAAEPLVPEWRGALFRVRLARLRLAATPPARVVVAPPPPARREVAAPAVAFALALGGALAFVLGATIGPWPLWVGGLLAVCASVLAYRP
jgi:hypothetical protein